jgi:leucyl-tRNA---protein transferase
MNRQRVPDLALYATPEHPCSYLPGKRATTLFADPCAEKDPQLYAELSALGFRRSGEHLYRPACEGCRACVPVRLEVNQFRPRRCQRRALIASRDLVSEWHPARFEDEHFDLYRRYLEARHPGGGMDHPTPAAFRSFLDSPWTQTFFLELRQPRTGELVAVGVSDVMDDAMSAVYTFFDPEESLRSPGRLVVLQEIAHTAQLGLRWLYLGYWLRDCAKMSYKNEYQPLEYFWGGRWQGQPPPEYAAGAPSGVRGSFPPLISAP